LVTVHTEVRAAGSKVYYRNITRLCPGKTSFAEPERKKRYIYLNKIYPRNHRSVQTG